MIGTCFASAGLGFELVSLRVGDIFSGRRLRRRPLERTARAARRRRHRDRSRRDEHLLRPRARKERPESGGSA